MKKEAMLDCEQRLAVFTWTYNDFPGPSSNEMMITMHANTAIAGPQHLRCNLMWALKMLPMQLIKDMHHEGTRFFERHRSPSQAQPIDLYYGLFGDPFSLNLLESTTNQSLKSGEIAIQDSQTLSLIPNTTTSLNILGSSNANIFLLIKFVGDPLPRSGVFYTALESLMELAQRDVDRVINAVSFTSSNFPVWFFGKSNPQLTPGFTFTTLHMILIAEAVAKECVVKGLYKELIWDFFADGKLAAGGCLTKPDVSRVSCEGLRPLLGGLSGNNTNTYASHEEDGHQPR